MSSTEYIFRTNRNTYHIIITDSTFTINGRNHRIRSTNGRYFWLDDGMAGSRFTITDANCTRAHYIVYGSGRPIITDEDGTLTRTQTQTQPQKTEIIRPFAESWKQDVVPGSYQNTEDYIKALMESRGYSTEKTTHQL